MATSDGVLVEKVLAGDTNCFRVLVERYQGAVFGVALARTGSFADAEDIAQDTFIAAFTGLQKLTRPSLFANWLYRTALNRAKQFIRGRAVRERWRVSQASAQGHAPPADELVARKETMARVMDALKRLPDASRETATLYYIDGYCQKEISRFLRCPLGTVGRRLHDARRHLKKELINMVESQLKSSAPGAEFTDQVLREITKVRALVYEDGVNGVLLLTDREKRSLQIFVSDEEARSILPWVASGRPGKAAEAYSALLDALDKFGCKVKGAAIVDHRAVMFFATLRIESPRGQTDVDCGPSDAINLAVRAGAPIFVHKNVANAFALKGPKGKPLSPGGAWRKIRHWSGVHRVFGNIDEVLKALEENPADEETRYALHDSALGEASLPRRIRKVKGGMEKFRAWVGSSHGTPFEATAHALMGEVLLSKQDWKGAIHFLQAAHRLDPKDTYTGWDLATAHSMTGQANAAFETLKEFDREWFSKNRFFTNWVKIRPDPRFKDFFGEAVPALNHAFFLPHFRICNTMWEPKSNRARWPRTISLSPRTLGTAQLSRLERLLGKGPLLSAKRLSATLGKGETAKQVVDLQLQGDGRIRVILEGQDAELMWNAFHQTRHDRPMTPRTFVNVLASAGIRLDSAALAKHTPRRWNGFLAASSEGRRTVISCTPGTALSVSYVADASILVARSPRPSRRPSEARSRPAPGDNQRRK